MCRIGQLHELRTRRDQMASQQVQAHSLLKGCIEITGTFKIVSQTLVELTIIISYYFLRELSLLEEILKNGGVNNQLMRETDHFFVIC